MLANGAGRAARTDMDARHIDLPRDIARLKRLSRDLWWTWNDVAQRPFRALDPERWEAFRHNPVALLKALEPGVLEARFQDPEFRVLLDAAEAARQSVKDESTWFESRHPSARGLRVAYFCSEFALHESMPQYAGGLGVLAGDHLRSASDLGVPIVGMGLLYRHGYYSQQLRRDGSTRVVYPRYDFLEWPIKDTGVEVDCPIDGRTVRARIWRVRLGRGRLYLLDTDLAHNRAKDRLLTQGLYKGEPSLRLRQQVLLGVGGILALRALRERVNVFHLNEGHAAFASLERVARRVRKGRSLEDAVQEVRRTTVFTTHTPVPAGHDRYDGAAVSKALRSVWQHTGLSEDAFLALGREPDGDERRFCMTVLALHLAEHVNGVAGIHGRVTREMWRKIYGCADPALVPISHVTNGVHLRTWIHPLAEAFWRRHAGIDLRNPNLDRDPWHDAAHTDPAALWELRRALRGQLVHFVRQRLLQQARRRGDGPEVEAEALSAFREDALTIGFARRFATYKRAPLIFRDPARLERLLANQDRPVQIVFAGKAHPRDADGQAYAREIHRLSRERAFAGRVALIEEYDMHVGRMLVSGCDLWLNTPLRPYEASGTSGMKPPLHGGINCSILDGWWPEGYDGTNGWAIGDGSESGDRDAQDARDAESLYGLLEREVVPAFWERDASGIPAAWMAKALRSVASIPGRFNTHRMVAEYVVKSYLPARGG